MITENQATLLISLIAMLISLMALIYTVLSYLLKSGSKIKGSFGFCSSIACEDKYISNLVLENLKDRSIVIYKVYLQLGHNYYLEIEDFEDEPLILKPFEVYKKCYDPIDFYSVNMNRILLNNLIDDKKVKKRLVLSTSTGKYKVKSINKHWDPIGLFFANYMTALIHPMRIMHKGQSYGINVKYIVDFTLENGEVETVAIYSRDYEIEKFKRFSLTKESLVSKEALEMYLRKKVSEGALKCENLTIYEMESRRNEVYKLEKKKVIKAKYYNWWMYSIGGFLYTKYSNYKMKKKTKKR